MPGEKTKESVDYENGMAQTGQKESICIDDLDKRVCYFSLSGDLALKAFGEKFSSYKKEQRKRKIKEELKQRLYLAILMFDVVVMHCSDPLRSEIVLEILEEHIQWIEDKRIVFIFSNHINDIKADYKKYINHKISDYSGGYCSEKEAQSLKQEHMTDEYYERVINVLDKTKTLVRKSKDKNCSFDRLVINDLNPQYQMENVIADAATKLPQILSLNVSLYQLLHMRYLKCDKEESQGLFVFPQKLVDEVIDNITNYLEQGNKIARSAIVDSLEEEIVRNTGSIGKVQKNVLKAITLRMDILYCKMNSGNQLILEFHPSYENRSNYQIDCFQEYLKIICDEEKIKLTPRKINSILHAEQLKLFRSEFLKCMADTREHIKLAQFNGNDSKLYQERLVELFQIVAVHNDIVNTELIPTIKDILKEAD